MDSLEKKIQDLVDSYNKVIAKSVRDSLVAELNKVIAIEGIQSKTEKKKLGCTIMTPGASAAADKKETKFTKAAKPTVL